MKGFKVSANICEYYVGGSDPDDDPQAKRIYRRIKQFRAAKYIKGKA